MVESIERLVERANDLLARGDLEEAMSLATSALARAPEDAAAHNLLGTILAKSGNPAEAERCYRRSIEHDAASYRPLANLSALLKSSGDLVQALALIARATELAPHLPRLFARRGQLERDLDQPDRSVESFQRAFELESSAVHRDAYGRALFEAGRIDRAVELIEGGDRVSRGGLVILAHAYDAQGRPRDVERVLATLCDSPPAPPIVLGLLKLVRRNELFELGLRLAHVARANAGDDVHVVERATAAIARCEEALGHDERALQVLEEQATCQPTEDVFALWLYARVRLHVGGDLDAVARRAKALYPGSVVVAAALGALYNAFDLPDEALDCFERAMSLEPDHAIVLAGLARAYASMGYHDRAKALHARALMLAPCDQATFAATLLPALHNPSTTAEECVARIRTWADRFGIVAQTSARHPSSLDPERRLRVGYLSSDFRDHPVARFIVPLLKHHDTRRFEIHCYGNVSASDAITHRIRSLDVVYHDVHGLDAVAVARRIAGDGIDIAIDLGGFTLGSLMLALAYRPAPLQLSYLGWPATSGIPEIDIRVTDALADPPGETERLHTEALVRLPHAAWCFDALTDVPVVPREEGAPLVLASFNRASKLSDALLRCWARVLRELPEAQLLIKGRTLFSATAQQRVRAVFDAEGIEAARVLLVGWTISTQSHLACWGDVDIALDSFPYAGTTTTCEALWMGVPVVTRTGEAHVSRVGASLLDAVGLSDLVASDWDGYVDRVVKLARDPARRRALRSSLRERFDGSTLGAGGTFTRSFEAMLRELWQRYVGSAHALMPEGARLARGTPPHFVDRSILGRAAFVSMEQGCERDDEASFACAVVGQLAASTGAALVVIRNGGHALPQALQLARAQSVSVILHEPTETTRRFARASAALGARDNLSVLGGDPDASTLARADLLELDADSALRLLADPKLDLERVFARLCFESAAQATLLTSAARARGLTVLRALPGLGVIVPVATGDALDSLARSFFVAGHAALDRLLSGRLAVTPKAPYRGAPTCREGVCALHAASKDELRDLADRAALLELAFEASSGPGVDDPTGARLTRARLAIETGRRGLLEGILSEVIERGGVPVGAFLPALESHDRRVSTDASWVVRQAIEALVLFGARSSFDRPRVHGPLIDRFFREGGVSPELNRRLGLLLALDRSA